MEDTGKEKNESKNPNPFMLFLILILLLKSFETAGFFRKTVKMEGSL
ncbi:hypothetical protein [Thermovenabulum sp.]